MVRREGDGRCEVEGELWQLGLESTEMRCLCDRGERFGRLGDGAAVLVVYYSRDMGCRLELGNLT